MRKGLALLLVLFLLTASYVSLVQHAWTATDSWESKMPMSGGRFGLGIVVVNGKIYAMDGGVNWEYDPAINTWTAKKPMPTERSFMDKLQPRRSR